MPDITLSGNIDIYCGGCGVGLCGQSDSEEKNGYWSITVIPCQKCLDDAKHEGYITGIDEGENG